MLPIMFRSMRNCTRHLLGLPTGAINCIEQELDAQEVVELILSFRSMSKHPLFSGTDRGRKSHLRYEGQTRSFTATMAVRVRQPWGSFGFIGGQTHSGDARDRRLFE